MTTIRATIRSTETTEVSGSGADTEKLRAELTSRLDGDKWDVTQISTDRKKDGTFDMRITARSAEVREMTVTGASYAEARSELLGKVPDGWQLLSVRTAD